ncbi:SOS response-associated peptidase family protein [Phenylobacterium montanum]|uniref:Abasic site processing protein n=1 Tax=Phenylobacterium montanum TaxID=2823693 RepID=A0A975G3R2_9CAUL|nr:SOS response-associated peptidase family protein [Caulobacter sp. S6]QUD90583.1 SOS response-associated peptidase family protein [Caulobacter sp. S6]
MLALSLAEGQGLAGCTRLRSAGLDVSENRSDPRRAMCNEYQLRLNFGADWWETAGKVKVPFHWRAASSNRPLNRPFKPTNRAPMLRAIDPANPSAGLEGLETRWWLVPFFHKGPVSGWKSMCTNAKIETVDTTPAFRDAYKRRRALIPITSFIEYDEPPGWRKGDPKRRWEVTWEPQDEFDRVRYFAGLWDRSNPSDMTEPLESFAFVTGPPGPEVGAVHDRQPAVLTLEQGLEWLRLDGPGKDMLVTETPAGIYQLTERAREMDFEAKA